MSSSRPALTAAQSTLNTPMHTCASWLEVYHWLVGEGVELYPEKDTDSSRAACAYGHVTDAHNYYEWHQAADGTVSVYDGEENFTVRDGEES